MLTDILPTQSATLTEIADLGSFITGSIASEFTASTVDAAHSMASSTWLTIATILVLFMQAGFLALESGWVRSKNSIGVAQKNIADFALCFLLFYAFGFMIAFGPSFSGIFGWSWSERSSFINDHMAQFLFQAVFAGTAITIASGALAERMKFKAYLLLIVFTSILVYPVVCHWAWGNLIKTENTSWLTSLGFIDFAGSTVVHIVGASIAFACALVIGPRAEKFDAEGNPVNLPCHSMVLSAVGALILLVGWLGFNAGAAIPGTQEFNLILLNTLLAASMGMTASLLLGYWIDGAFQPRRTINGMIGGLVGITASCKYLDPNSALLVGLICGVIVGYAEDFIEKVMKIDDVVGAIAVHGSCGIAGTLLFALLAPIESLPTGARFDQFCVQLLGCIAAILYSFTLTYVFLALLSMMMTIRVSITEEIEGSNLSEHMITLETEVLLEKERRINEEQRQFIRMASHEFRTPLAIIDSVAQSLKRRWAKYTQTEADTKLTDIRKSVKRLSNLIDTTLDVGKIENGSFHFNPKNLNIDEFLTEKVRQFELMTEKHKVTLHKTCTEGLLIYADQIMLDHIFDNLLSNAAKYSPQAEKIDIHITSNKTHLEVTIRDYGLGIPKDEIPKLFGKYFRASTSAGIGGTGIGLTVVKKFIDLHKGSIRVESEVGNGTSFIFSFPIANDQTAHLKQSA